MPLRDHFHFAMLGIASWEEVHGGWPMVIVQHLFGLLPKGYVAAPRVHLGPEMEVDVAAYERSTDLRSEVVDHGNGQGGAATAVAAPPLPTLEIEGSLPDQDEYEVRVYDATQNRQLVAAIEIVSPGNFNLYMELLDALGRSDPVFSPKPSSIYAVTCRGRSVRGRWRVESWEHVLEIGSPLPTLPLWLTESMYVPLELETTYENTCCGLRIR